VQLAIGHVSCIPHLPVLKCYNSTDPNWYQTYLPDSQDNCDSGGLLFTAARAQMAPSRSICMEEYVGIMSFANTHEEGIWHSWPQSQAQSDMWQSHDRRNARIQRHDLPSMSMMYNTVILAISIYPPQYHQTSWIRSTYTYLESILSQLWVVLIMYA
jgi:hypothetical protein